MVRQTHDEAPSQDVVDLLVEQHAMIRELFARVTGADARNRRATFEELARLLAIHETAEEEVVHPLARRLLPGGDGVVRDRLDEEEKAKEMLARLDEMDAESPEFLSLLDELRMAVLTHAQYEERYEFLYLRQQGSPDQLARLVGAVRAAEAVAPTRPHPGMESATGNLLAGPVLALFDRMKDAVRKARTNET
ncbi:Hemerythrin HHE cation binding domain-containing protein [Streptoalloteichus tenebrarius]|uniref:Hemerythrin HHE cation binding domain-containing protein n=1 Tax=Streptoalloteichus tenebrarius (strain ATCC 17920 / DSM 40477 / JCM 4838 / CBS 697.72 / NBRC 16177 / NCIMB 11028 / NRRL B-12390 / A12253. 1 / ISP 5477) TaxID=1933 RepID=A0ABT1HLL1_STRSD|nr:hemerythrin domain-containing protein [Streptoalloteichus tenebrarius]MCP2256406.1 Hemerythrin HHE cation binding domain-containing protein [Streptoalloteichus tenebrarius]